MTKKKKAPPRRTEKSLAALERRKDGMASVEMLARSQVSLLLRGITDEMDGACGRIGPYCEDYDAVYSAISAALPRMAELSQQLVPRWYDAIIERDVARKAWRAAGGEE